MHSRRHRHQLESLCSHPYKTDGQNLAAAEEPDSTVQQSTNLPETTRFEQEQSESNKTPKL